MEHKTAKTILNEWMEELPVFSDAAIQAMQEYATQQTASLRKYYGLLEINRDHEKRLRLSCEQALEKSHNKNQSLRKEIDRLKEYVNSDNEALINENQSLRKELEEVKSELDQKQRECDKFRAALNKIITEPIPTKVQMMVIAKNQLNNQEG